MNAQRPGDGTLSTLARAGSRNAYIQPSCSRLCASFQIFVM
jgi:hypothetical protein